MVSHLDYTEHQTSAAPESVLDANMSCVLEDDYFTTSIYSESDGENEENNFISDGQRPQGWLPKLSSAFERVLAEAKGAASRQVVSFIKKHLRGTKLILVVGQSGTGKSTLLSEMTGQSLDIGKTIKSGTKNHRVCPGIIDNEQYLFIDTAGFGAADIDDIENFGDITACLDALAPFVTIAGVLFVYGGGQERMMQHDLKTIKWIQCFCGPDYYRHITIVTTKWDQWSEDDFEDAWNRLSTLLGDPSVTDIISPVSSTSSRRYHGCNVYHHGVVFDENSQNIPSRRLSRKTCTKERSAALQAMIKDNYRNNPKVEPQFVRELVEKIPWNQTQAAKVLNCNPQKTKLEIKEDFILVSQAVDFQDFSGETGQYPEKRFRNSPSTERPDGSISSDNKSTSHLSDEDDSSPQSSSWLKGLLDWFGIAYEVASYFAEAGRKASGSSEVSWMGFWGTFQYWWAETPEKS